MVEIPHTRYVKVADADVAYQALGEGPVDLLYFYGLGNHVDLGWDSPVSAPIQPLPSQTRFSETVLPGLQE